MKPNREEIELLTLPTAIAVIGMAGRFPGARNLDEFRRNLENGIESITTFTDQELRQAGVDPQLLSNPNYVKVAPLLPDADMFDASFFEYSPREAAIMDPQQRLFLECAWEALEDAGHAGDAYGSLTGVFSGAGGIMSTYLLSDTHFNPALTGTTASLQHVGNDKDYLSTRVSYKLNLRGPSLTVQTACSTSMVAIHMACRSLLGGECDMALAGGTTVRVPQRAGYLYKEGNVFSRDGHCRAFDAGATGTVFGSGIGVVVLKRLKDALRDGDTVRAVIRATVINNDGSESKTSYWAPHAEGQADAMRRALADARVEPSTIGYVETHGTATQKGDPTEVKALAQAFGPLPAGSCAIGSVKSNIGHPESAAGVAGLIKAVLSLEHKVLFPSLHYSRPNPEIDFDHGFHVNAVQRVWERREYPRRAAVNSLGIGGTNAFAILEEAPEQRAVSARQERPCYVLPLSAKTPEALEALANNVATFLRQRPDLPIADVCFSAGAGRAHFDHRLALVGGSLEQLAELASSSPSSGHAETGRVVAGKRLSTAFLFTGQGSQYVGMARELYETQPVFRQMFDRCADGFSSHLGRLLSDVVYGHSADGALINDTSYTQPALFAVEYALAAMWRAWGIEPAVVMGHSIGEIVAASVCGVMSLDDAICLTAARARLMGALPRGGAMAAIRCDAARAAQAIAAYGESVAVAAINGPTDVVVSGRVDDVESIVSAFERDGVAATRLKVSHAFHSPLMDPMLEEFGQVAASIAYSAPAIPLVSNVTGRLAGPEIATPEYWVRHVRESVRFAEGVRAVHAQGIDVFLEVGPSPVLLGMARQSVPQGGEAWLPSVRPGRSDWRQIGESLAVLYARGATVDWRAVHSGAECRRVQLPTYPFQRQRYWIDPPAALSAPVGSLDRSLLGQRLRLPNSSEVRFEARWTAHCPPYLDDHRIFDTVVVPGASHIAMALCAMKQITGAAECAIEDVVFPQALTLPDESVRTAQLIVQREGGRETAFQVVSLRDGEDDTDSASWLVHATGRLGRGTDGAPSADPDAWRTRCTRSSSGADFYERFWQAGYHLRGAFRWITRTWGGDDEILCEFSWPELPDDPDDYPLYPSLIDACFQSVFSDRGCELLKKDAVYVPFSIRRFTFARSPRPGTPLWCHITLRRGEGAGSSVDAEIVLAEGDGRVVAAIEGCQLREIRREALINEPPRELTDAVYEVHWQPVPRVSVPAVREPGAWIIFACDVSPAANDIIAHLQSRGERCIRIDRGSRYSTIAADRYQVSGEDPGELRQLLADLLERERMRCRGIVHSWALDVRPVSEDVTAPLHAVSSVLHLVQAIASVDWKKAPRLWLLTAGADPLPTAHHIALQQSPLCALARVIALEHPELSCTRVDLDPSDSAASAQQLVEDLCAPDEEDALAYRRGLRYAARLVRSEAVKEETRSPRSASEAIQVRLSNYGQLENLVVEPLTRRAPRPGEVEIEVRAVGLNFRDVLNALGLLREHYAKHLGINSAAQMTFGFECAGTITAIGEGVSRFAVGDQVMAVASHDALGSFVTLPADFVAPKPPSLGFEEAATLPLAFLTAHYGLHQLAGLQRGERVLIHAAAGGVGQACVQLAQRAGAEVFATASPAKWSVLKAQGVKHVLNSRTLDFATAIAGLTGGAGVDVVVNTLSGEFVDKSFAVLKDGGRFIELGKRDVWSDARVREHRPDVSYFPFDLVDVSQRDPKAIAAMLDELVKSLESGAVKPLPHTAFPVAQVADAFRFMAEARHVGKIVISMPSVVAREGGTLAIRDDATYLITGGAGALGLEVAACLVAEGARHIVLTSRHRPEGEASDAVERLRAAGATIAIIEADVAEATHVARVLEQISTSLPPLRGIVHAAGVLDDGVLLQQTAERFRQVMAPKVEGAWHLHVLTRHMPLDFFVCFSSVASLLGNAGQGSYAAANAFMDALAHQRRAEGLSGSSINWGPWDEVGMAADTGGQRHRHLTDQGFRMIDRQQGIRAFRRLLAAPVPQIGVLPINWSEYQRANPGGRPFLQNVAAPQVKPALPKQESDVARKLAQAADPRPVVAQHVRSVVGKVLGLNESDRLDPRARLFDLGLESLMAVEMRGRFEQSLGCTLRPTLLFDYPTIEALIDHLVAKISEQRAAAAAAAAPAVPPGVGELDALEEDELAARLADELAALSRSPGQ